MKKSILLFYGHISHAWKLTALANLFPVYMLSPETRRALRNNQSIQPTHNRKRQAIWHYYSTFVQKTYRRCSPTQMYSWQRWSQVCILSMDQSRHLEQVWLFTWGVGA